VVTKACFTEHLELEESLHKTGPGSRAFDGFICFGGEDWWYHNRGHIDMQLMRRFSRICTTIYINSIVMQKPNIRQAKSFFVKLTRKLKSIFKGLRKTEAGFWAYSPLSLPCHHIALLRPVNKLILRLQVTNTARKLNITRPVIWIACPAACDIAIRMKGIKLVYQRTDCFEEYPNVATSTIIQYDRRLKANADLTVFVNRTLYEQERRQCKRAIYLDHGVDYEMFASAHENPYQPGDISVVPKPIIGFYGGFGEHTTDIGLLEKIVDLLPDKSFVFVGQASEGCSGLMARKNVWFLGRKPYEQIPHYGKLFDVAIMPWKQNRWIEACNPVKLKEYLALGKPVVSTPFNELKKYLDVVYTAETPEDFAKAILRALAEDSPIRTAGRRAKVANTSWDTKAKTVLRGLFGNSEINA